MTKPDIATKEWFEMRDKPRAAMPEPLIPAMTEDQIEIWAERMQDRLDNTYMTTDMRTAQYNHESREIALWVEQAHEHRRRTVELAQWNNQHA